jgi:hypothetical protein
MPTAGLAPLDETITIAELTRDPYVGYQLIRLLQGPAGGRTSNHSWTGMTKS